MIEFGLLPHQDNRWALGALIWNNSVREYQDFQTLSLLSRLDYNCKEIHQNFTTAFPKALDLLKLMASCLEGHFTNDDRTEWLDYLLVVINIKLVKDQKPSI